jgi:hypothetical protein
MRPLSQEPAMAPHLAFTPNPALKLRFSIQTKKTTKTMTDIRDPHSIISTIGLTRFRSEFQLS